MANLLCSILFVSPIKTIVFSNTRATLCLLSFIVCFDTKISPKRCFFLSYFFAFFINYNEMQRNVRTCTYRKLIHYWRAWKNNTNKNGSHSCVGISIMTDYNWLLMFLISCKIRKFLLRKMIFEILIYSYFFESNVVSRAYFFHFFGMNVEDFLNLN